jgi:hypothetical protein
MSWNRRDGFELPDEIIGSVRTRKVRFSLDSVCNNMVTYTDADTGGIG